MDYINYKNIPCSIAFFLSFRNSINRSINMFPALMLFHINPNLKCKTQIEFTNHNYMYQRLR